ncbi:MAG: hypothetical protein IPL37_07555 [Austwickia sp.]|nr:hypothetical protein [Austwickia sp.]
MYVDRPMRFALTVTACAVVGSAIGLLVLGSLWRGGPGDVAELWIGLLPCLAAGGAAAYVEHRLRHRLRWPPEGPSRVIGPLVAAATAYTVLWSLVVLADAAMAGRGAGDIVNEISFSWLVIWLFYPIAPAATAVTGAFLVWLHRRRLAALAAAGIAPVTCLTGRDEVDEDREIERPVTTDRRGPIIGG